MSRRPASVAAGRPERQHGADGCHNHGEEEHDLLLWSDLPVGVDEMDSPGRLGGGLTVGGVLRRAKYHHDMSRKYWRAAARPCLASACKLAPADQAAVCRSAGERLD